MKRSPFAAIARRSVAALPLFVITAAVALAQTPSNDSSKTSAGAATPAPIFTLAPTPAPRPSGANPFTFGGHVRAYEFYRTNGVQNSSNPNRQAFNADASVHLEYHPTGGPWYLATTYDGAYPFGLDGKNAGANPYVDNSLPGFALSTFDEAFLGYSNATVQAKIGDQIINTPWANAADSRLKPAAFQGADFTVAVTPQLTAFFYDMDRFESRTSSAFGRYTLLTASAPGASNALSPSTAEIDTSGFQMGGLAFQPGKNWEIALMDYRFDQIASMLYVQGLVNMTPHSPYHVTAAVQYDHETDDGTGVVGKIENQTVGLQFAATVTNLTLQAGGDYAPWNSATVPLAACSSATYLTTGYFLPSGGTPDCVANGNRTATIYYGGIASPYTDSYAVDPLFTTSISQGMVDRRSAGTSEKASATYQPFARQLRLIVSEAWYNYGNPAGPNVTREFDADATYFFNRLRAGAYKGFSVRYRYADRTQPTLPYDFKYNRAQLEYDF